MLKQALKMTLSWVEYNELLLPKGTNKVQICTEEMHNIEMGEIGLILLLARALG